MKTLILATTLLPLLTSVTAQSGPSFVGCYKSSGSLTARETDNSNSPNTCRDTCTEAGNFPVEAMTGGTGCYCGASLPPASDKVEDSRCGASCPGAASETCGSTAGDFFSVYLTGVNSSPPVDTNNGTITAAGGNNTTTTKDGSATIQTSIPGNKTTTTGGDGHGDTTSAGPGATKTGGSGGAAGASATASSTGKKSSGDNVQVGGGMLVGVVMGVLAMIF